MARQSHDDPCYSGSVACLHQRIIHAVLANRVLICVRLVLQGNPMAYLVESAGGRAITHEGPVLDILPTSIHERCPIFLGSRVDIEELEAFLHAKA